MLAFVPAGINMQLSEGLHMTLGHHCSGNFKQTAPSYVLESMVVCFESVHAAYRGGDVFSRAVIAHGKQLILAWVLHIPHHRSVTSWFRLQLLANMGPRAHDSQQAHVFAQNAQLP